MSRPPKLTEPAVKRFWSGVRETENELHPYVRDRYPELCQAVHDHRGE